MKYRLLHNNPLQFYDTNAELVGTISANGSNLKITSNSGVIELGNTASDIQVGTLGTSINWTFLGGGTIGAGGIGTINMGQSGDTINMNVAGVTYQYPASFLRFNEITGTNNKINITTQVPGSVVLSLPQRPVVGQLQLTDAVPSTSNLTGALIVAGGAGIAGNLSVTNATINGQLGISAPNDSAARLKITATSAGAVFNHADNSNIFFQTQGVNRLTINDATGNGTLQGNLTVQGTSTSVSTTTGALTVAGGLGVAGNVYSGGVYDTGVNIIGFAGRAFNHANAAFTSANLISGIDTTQNNSITAAFLAANSAATLSAATDLTQNNSITAAFLAANSAATLSAATDLTQNNSITAAFTRANNSISANAGGTITGDLVVTGNFTVSGATTYANTINVQLGDNIITLNAELPTSVTPSENAGFEINRGNTLANASLLWVESAGKWQANSGAATGAYFIGSESAGIYANGAFAAANAAGTTNTTQNNSITASFTQANLAVVNALAASNYANASFAVANQSLLIDTTQNNSITAAFTQANLAIVNALSASNYANAAFLIANASLLIDTTQNNSITAAFTAANNRVLKSGDTMTGNLVINSASSHGLIVTNTSTSGAIAFGGTNGRTLTALQGASVSNFDFNASQVYYNGDLLVGGKVSSPNGSTANLFLTATYNGATIYTDRGVYVACTNAAISNSSGALVLNGGLGITGNLFMSSANNFTGSGNGGSYRLGWTDNYFLRSHQFGGVQFIGSYLSLLTNTYVESGYNLVIRGQIYNDFGDLRVGFNALSGVNVANVQVATTNTSGSLIVYGGAGIRGNVYSGGIYLTGATSNGITFTDGTKQTSAGAGIGDVLALSIALG